MPKRVMGKCPECKRLIPKRYGRLEHHPPERKAKPGDDLCPGSWKRVPTHRPGN